MGLIKDALGSAFGADQPKNGLGGSMLSFSKSNSSSRYTSPSPSPRLGGSSSFDPGWTGRNDGYNRSPEYNRPMQSSSYPQSLPPAYDDDQAYSRDTPQSGFHRDQYENCTFLSPSSALQSNYSGGFQPLALPQISPGEGSPFLRGYSSNLYNFGISEREFFELVDCVNAAIVPNPEMQIFQKAASIAGWFVPGAESIGIMAGQIGVGIAGALGHSAGIKKVLSKANLEVFIPRNLEICIGKAKDVNALVEVAFPPRRFQSSPSYSSYSSYISSQSSSSPSMAPEDRIAEYGDLLAPITRSLPPLQGGPSRRRDPIAMIGKGMSEKDSRRKMQRAERGLARGRGKKADAIEVELQWLMVKEASAKSVAFWKNTLRESEVELEQEQRLQQQQQYQQQQYQQQQPQQQRQGRRRRERY